VARELGLAPEDWSIAFQSRIGTQEWLKPYTDIVLTDYAKNGPKRVTVICPGFATDCLETLEEIAMRGREDFLAAGGEHFSYVPALNDTTAHAELLAQVALQHASGWPEAQQDYAAAAAQEEADAARARALAMGSDR
jgi:ferrochelatase